MRAALQPIFGAERVTRLLTSTIAKHSRTDFRIIEVNVEPGLLIRLSEQWYVCSVEITADGLISGVQWMSNPDKLERIALDAEPGPAGNNRQR